MGWKHYQTVDLSKESPRLVEHCLASIYELFTSNFNFLNPSNLQHFLFSSIKPILWEKISLSQNAQQSAQNRQTVVIVISIEI